MAKCSHGKERPKVRANAVVQDVKSQARYLQSPNPEFQRLPTGSIVVPFGGSYAESYKVFPKRNYYGACW